MNFLLEFTAEQFAQKKLPVADILSSGGMVVLTGMLTVFAVLCLLWFTLVAFKFFFYDLKRKTKTKEINDEPVPVKQPAVSSDNDEIIAVIAAAIAMAESELGGSKQFRVVSFKRK